MSEPATKDSKIMSDHSGEPHMEEDEWSTAVVQAAPGNVVSAIAA